MEHRKPRDSEEGFRNGTGVTLEDLVHQIHTPQPADAWSYIVLVDAKAHANVWLAGVVIKISTVAEWSQMVLNGAGLSRMVSGGHRLRSDTRVGTMVWPLTGRSVCAWLSGVYLVWT